MKKKLLCLVLVFCLTIPSLTSCLLRDSDLKLGIREPAGDTNITVEGGPVIENIQINSNSNTNLLAASRALLSVVKITSIFGTGDDAYAAMGSGVIYKLDKNKGDAYIITNYHVVYDGYTEANGGICQDIILHLYGMEYMAEGEKTYEIPATFVGGSMNYDLAVLKVTGSTVLMESSAMAVTVADSNEVSILETAIAIGNPGNNGISATVGSINVDSEKITIGFDTPEGTVPVELRVMRTDAAASKGNSGGGLFNDKGELIGIVSAKDSDTTLIDISYAIPSNVVRAIADNAIYYNDGTIKRCLLGITVGSARYYTEYDTETGKVHRCEDVVITEFSKTSAVKDYFKIGDNIKSINIDGVSYEVTRIFHVVDAMLNARVGSSVITTVVRDGVEMEIPITVTQNMLTVY